MQHDELTPTVRSSDGVLGSGVEFATTCKVGADVAKSSYAT
jgi:hypothetical protein